MDPDRTTPPPWLPAVRPPTPPPAPVDPPASEPPRARWRKLTRSPRGAAGLAIAAAALLLWPFAGWSWLPWVAGLVLLILLRLLRLDGLLRGWALHLGGLVVVVGLMYSTGPWAWALAASIGVLLAGLLQLPAWKLAAVGAALCVVTGVGFGLTTVQNARQAAAEQRQRSVENYGQIAEEADRILPVMIQAINGSQPDPELLCNILTPDARQTLAKIAGVDACRSAVPVLYGRAAGQREVVTPARLGPKLDAAQPAPATLVLDGCATPWVAAVGKAYGRPKLQLLSGTERTYVVAGFAAC
jgi:hypothetical protein